MQSLGFLAIRGCFIGISHVYIGLRQPENASYLTQKGETERPGVGSTRSYGKNLGKITDQRDSLGLILVGAESVE